VRVEAVGKKVRGLFAGFVGGGGGDQQGYEGVGAEGRATGSGHGHKGVRGKSRMNNGEDTGLTQTQAKGDVPRRNKTIRLRFKRKDRVDTLRG
jgi:hypothetical protein